MRTYQPPQLQVYGSVQSLTGALGAEVDGDTFYGFDGPESELGSRDTCEFDRATGDYADPCSSDGTPP